LSACPPNVTIYCNDGNNRNGDGCDSNCQIEDGWKCPAAEVIGPCVCYCIKPTNPPTCGCDWVSTGCGAPLPTMADFNKIGARFEQATQPNIIPQGFKFSRCGCNKNTFYTEKDKTAACPNRAGLSTNEGLIMKLAAVPSEGLSYDKDQITWVSWVGTPLRSVTALERLAFECPPGKVPTEIYFEKAGCNSNTNISSFAWITKWSAQQYPGCFAGSRGFNDGLSMVAVCRPDASLARGRWMWMDAGFASPIVNPSDLENIGGLCPAGYAMTGAYFNSAGCGATLKWNQALVASQVTPKCSANQRDANGKLLINGLNLRLKCTAFGRDIHECGVLAPHYEWPCDTNAQCVDAFGGKRCKCNPGYDGNGRNGTCFPINPCVEDENSCAPAPGGVCTNTAPGQFKCSCAAGYTDVNGNGKLCRPAARVISTTETVFPRFRAQCMFGLTGSGISGTIDFKTQVDASGNPLGTIIEVSVGGANLPKVVRWDIREQSVDTENNSLDSCWDAGKIYAGAGKDGLTSKYGKLKNMKVYDPDVKLFGPLSVQGRSIVLEEEDGDYLDCCTIHIDIDDSPYSPAKPKWQKSTSAATCKFPDGRQVVFTQNNEFVGTNNGGNEDRPGGHSVGSTIALNPRTEVINTNFNTPASALVWRQRTAGSPPIEACGNLFLLGGTTSQSTGAYMDYAIPSNRYFRSVTIELTYHALGSWENEWALVQLIVANPAMTFPVWSQLYNGNAACTATANRFNVKVTYPLARNQQTATIRITSSLDSTTGESFAISNFKVTLEPYNELYVTRNRDFTGASDLSSWSKVSGGVKPPPAVGPCVTGGTTYALLGGSEVLKTGDSLEYRKINIAPFTRLQILARLWFLGNWQGQTIIIEMINEGVGAQQTIQVWSSTGVHRPTSTLNCDNSGFKDYFVDLNIDQSFRRSSNTAYIRIRVVGTLNQASWAFSSWTVNALPTGTSIDVYQDRFRAQRAPGWAISDNNEVSWRAIVASDYRQCSNAQSSLTMWGHDRVVEGFRGRFLRYSQSNLPTFTQAVLTWEFYFLDSWDSEYAKMKVAGIGEVWSKIWGQVIQRYGYRQRICNHYAGAGYGAVVQDSVLVTFPAPRNNITLTFWSTLNEAPQNEEWAVGALRITLLPNPEEMQTEGEVTDSLRWRWGTTRWEGPSQTFRTAPPNSFAAAGLPKCTIPNELTPAVRMVSGDDRVHNLLGYRSGVNRETRYTVTTNRPYTKALVRFYQWWLDDWDNEWLWVRHRSTNSVIKDSPMRYLFKETLDYRDLGLLQSFCASSGGTLFDEARYRALWLLEPQTSTTIDLFWGSTLNSPIEDESYAQSRLFHTTFAEVPSNRIMTFTPGQFATPALRAAFKTPGGILGGAITFCGGETALYGYSGADDTITYTLDPPGSEPFKTFRIHFRYWFIGAWAGERAYLYVTSDSGEWVNAMRDDWTQGADLQYSAATNGRRFYQWCSGGNYGRFTRNDHYVDYYIEVSFATATTKAQLVWSNNLKQGYTFQSFAISHITLDWYPIQKGFTIETSTFASTGNTLEGFETQEGGRWAPTTVVTQCGVSPKHALVGGRTRLSPLEKLRFTSKPAESPEAFSKVYVYFRYWFLPTWNLNTKATLAIAEKGRAAQQQWEMIFPFPLAQPVNTPSSPLNCNINQNMYKDIVVAVQFPRNIQELELTWGIAAPAGQTTARFAISAFKMEYERPFPDWTIQTACVAAPWRPNDGNQLNVGGQWMGLGDMTRKHGQFVNRPEFIDNSIILHSTFNIIGKKIALYPPGKTTGQVCCDIVGNGVNFPAPALPRADSAGCVWRNKDTEGYIGFRTSGSTIRNGVTVSVFAKFFGNEATATHAYSINYRGFGQPELVANQRCPATLTGGIYGTGLEPDDFIGPTSASLGLGNPPFPGTPGSSRARIGDLSGKHGLLPKTMASELVYIDGQVTLSGPFSVMGRSVVINGINGPIGCCTIGFGPVGGPDRGFDYFDNLGNFTNPNGLDNAPEDPFAVVDPEGDLQVESADSWAYWSAGRIAALAIGIAAAIALVAAIIASMMGGGGAAAGDVGDGYVAM